MLIPPPTQTNNPTFGYSSPLKTLYKRGKLPVKYGFYGGRLTQSNVSLEHLKTHSHGGKTELSNLVLATKENNQNRGVEPLINYITPKNITRYLQQFIGVRVDGFDGNRYIAGILKTLETLL